MDFVDGIVGLVGGVEWEIVRLLCGLFVLWIVWVGFV